LGEAVPRKVRSAFVWRALQSLLPLGQRYNALIRCVIAPRGLVAVRWGPHRLTLDAAWLRVPSSASAPIYRGPRRQNPEFFALLAPMLAEAREGLFVDVGANIGVYTLDARAVSARPILAFEPEPSIFALLARNVVGNTLPQIELRNLACGDWSGTLPFHSGINGAVAREADGGGASVPVVRLDDELRGRDVAVIKIDCEGYEWQVLSGCREMIAARRPTLFVELHPRLIGRYGHSLEDVCDLLRPHYELAFWMFAPAPRSRPGRFLMRYWPGLRRLPDEAAMLKVVTQGQPPDQIFLCATPRGP
jgi:FkbM family methyltransferase